MQGKHQEEGVIEEDSVRVREGAESEGVEEMIDLRETLYPMVPEIEEG